VFGTGLILPFETIYPDASSRPLHVAVRSELHGRRGPRPAVTGALLATSPDAVWWGGALALAMTGAGFLRLGHRIPDTLLRTKSQAAGSGSGADLMLPHQTASLWSQPGSNR
jgi:hypothetical protein